MSCNVISHSACVSIKISWNCPFKFPPYQPWARSSLCMGVELVLFCHSVAELVRQDSPNYIGHHVFRGHMSQGLIVHVHVTMYSIIINSYSICTVHTQKCFKKFIIFLTFNVSWCYFYMHTWRDCSSMTFLNSGFSWINSFNFCWENFVTT